MARHSATTRTLVLVFLAAVLVAGAFALVGRLAFKEEARPVSEAEKTRFWLRLEEEARRQRQAQRQKEADRASRTADGNQGAAASFSTPTNGQLR